MFYDPMIAKLVTWAPSREAAIDAQIASLDQFVIDGISDNVDFLSALMQHPRYRSGEITTGFIADEFPEGFEGAPADEQLIEDLTAIAGMSASLACVTALSASVPLPRRRDFAKLSASLSARRANPSAAAPTVTRNRFSVSIPIRNPSPGSPMIALAGMRTLSYFSRPNGCGAMTSIRSSTVTASAGTMKADSPRDPSPSPVRAKVT